MGNQLPVKNSADNLLPGHVRLLSSVADKSPPLRGQKSAARRSPLGSPPRKSAQADKVRQGVRVVAESAIKSPRRTESPQADLSSGHADFFGGSFRQSASEPLGPARTPPKVAEVRRIPPRTGGVRLGGILDGVRAGPLGSAADKSPPRIMPK